MALILFLLFFFNDTSTTEIYTLSLHDALPIWRTLGSWMRQRARKTRWRWPPERLSMGRWNKSVRSRSLAVFWMTRSEEHTSELQSRLHLVCRLLLEKKKISSRSR